MRYFLLFIAIIAISFFFTGCTSSQINNFDSADTIPLLGTAAAGYGGYMATKNQSRNMQMMTTLGAAAGGYTVAEIIRAEIKEQRKEKFRIGYSLGYEDGMYNQNHILKTIQKSKDRSICNEEYTTYTFPALTNTGGVNFVPHTVNMRVIK